MKLLLYCKKVKPNLWKYEEDYLKYLRSLGVKVSQFELGNKVSKKDATHKYCEKYMDKVANLNGKITVECDFEVEKISNDNPMFDTNYRTKSLSGTELMKFSCLTNYNLVDYLGDDKGYAIHIKNLHIFDEPRKLSDCIAIKRGMEYFCSEMFNPSEEGDIFNYLKSVPNKIRKVWFEKYGMIKPYFIIPVSPEEMCRIANKKQTVLVRRNVLKEML